MKLLYAEDEPSMSEAVVDILEYHNYNVDPVYNGLDAYEYAKVGEYDGIILDVMMPKMSGFEVLEKLRVENCMTPILILTAKSEVEDRINGLDLGADDYLPKPFAMGELLARVRAMLRRRENYTPDIMTCGKLTLNRHNYELSNGNQSFVLPKQEFKLIETLMLNRGKYLSTEKLLAEVWGYDTDAELGSVWVYISHIRKKLALLDSTVEIVAKRNIGYSLEVTSND